MEFKMNTDSLLSWFLLFFVVLPCAKCFPVDLVEEVDTEADIAEISRLAEHVESAEIILRDKRGVMRIAKILRAMYNTSGKYGILCFSTWLL
jgi:hypothetical protein